MRARAAQLTTLRASDERAAAALLARAFADDPLSAWLFPHPGRRMRLLRSLFLHTIRDSLPFGAVDAARTGDHLSGVGLSLPPGAFPPTAFRTARMLPTLGLAAVLAPNRLRCVKRVLAEDARAHIAEAHWYAQAIAVDDSQRGRGVGSALLAAMLDRADRDSVATFLVTSNPRNRDWYSRHGFVTLTNVRVMSDAPTYWPMARPWQARQS
jgi:GNAT superfamily N-acetyltransferase